MEYTFEGKENKITAEHLKNRTRNQIIMAMLTKSFQKTAFMEKWWKYYEFIYS